MTRTRNSRSARTAALFAAVVALSVAPRAGAQGVILRAAVPSATTGEGGVVTTVFTIANTSRAAANIAATLDVPSGWMQIAGLAPRAIAAGSSDTWIVGIVAPSSTPAGTYALRARITADGVVSHDSVTIIVAERRSLHIMAEEAPGWTAMGREYQAAFLVQNRGNAHATLALHGTTSRGAAAVALPSTLTLAPGSVSRVVVRIAPGPRAATLSDDVIELAAVDAADSTSATSASARTLLVPDASSLPTFETVPATLQLRTANGAAGVSPLILAGSGRVNDARTAVDFLVQAPSNQDAPVGFGERDEYRLSVESGAYRVRLGDHLFGWSPLASGATLGTGAEVRATHGAFESGVYAQHPRWSPSVRGEQGAYVGLSADSILRTTAAVLFRQPTDGSAVRVASVRSIARISRGARLELEGARSDSAGALDNAYRVRLTGSGHGVAYDADASRGGHDFAGPYRGGMTRGASIASQVSGTVSASAAARVNEWGAPTLRGAMTGEHLSTANVSVSWKGSATIEYGQLARRDLALPAMSGGTQRGVRASTSVRIASLVLTSGVERGVVQRADTAHSTTYTQAFATLSAHAGARGSISVNATVNRGNTLTGASNGVMDFGISSNITLPLGLTVSATGSAQRATLGVLDSSGAWFSVLDARLDRGFANGSSIGVHARTMQSPYVMHGQSGRAVYLEYRAPLRMPAIKAHARNRVIGRVTRADDGTPVAGALVRLGTAAAITDKEGRAYFTGVASQAYRVTLVATGAAAGAMLDGDVVVTVPENGQRTTEFALSVTRGANVTASVRTFQRAGTLGVAADSLVDAGGTANVLVRLEGARDTVYRASDESGRVEFGSVVPGTYTVSVRTADAPANAQFERDHVQLVVAAGGRGVAEFRLLPQARAVRMIDARGEIIIPKGK